MYLYDVLLNRSTHQIYRSFVMENSTKIIGRPFAIITGKNFQVFFLHNFFDETNLLMSTKRKTLENSNKDIYIELELYFKES